MMLIVSSSCSVTELEEKLLTAELVKAIHGGAVAAFKLLHGHYWMLVYCPKNRRMMWYPLDGSGEPERVDRT